MGTNYYLHRDICPHCGRSAEGSSPSAGLHIGKSSSGWCFSLATHPEEHIHGLDDWVRAWSRSDAKILDEYGEPVTTEAMFSVITERSHGRTLPDHPAYFAQAGGVPGPNNLLRHKVDGRFCLAHGRGTYDLMRGEFS